jgi:hypothetical protein
MFESCRASVGSGYMRLMWTVFVALTTVATSAAAQTAIGGAFIVSRLPAEASSRARQRPRN